LAFGDLQDDLATDGVEFWNVLDRDLLAFAFTLLLGLVVAYDFNRVVVGDREDVPVVEEGVFGFTDVDEGSF
jgi:hypothetical protein